ncbi:MAG TPA: DUF456 domain-containing protein [Pirellulales bacterium]|nr:DUF456 domain-containing protein [Pirellulales bacterium]
MIYVGLLLLILALVVGWCMTMLSMPGNWVMVAAVGLFAWLAPPDGPDIGWPVFFVLLGLAVLAELLELAASALGASRAGGSRRGAVLAIFGSMVGAVAGAMIGLPIPLVGSLIAAIVFAGIGAMAGAMLGETWKGRTLSETWKVGQAAFWGRLLGALAKTGIATAMLFIALISAVF